jgi:signal transduction histidine kinase
MVTQSITVIRQSITISGSWTQDEARTGQRPIQQARDSSERYLIMEAQSGRLDVYTQPRVPLGLRQDGATEAPAKLVRESWWGGNRRRVPVILRQASGSSRHAAKRFRYWPQSTSLQPTQPGSPSQPVIDQHVAAAAALDQTNPRLHEVELRLLMEREEERKHLARELHDQVIQDLISINYQLEMIFGDASQHAGELTAVRDNIRAVIDNVRHICTDLRPPTIDCLGLGAAIRAYAYDWSTHTGIAVRLDVDAGWVRLPEPVELSVFRIVQEGLSNVRKHSLATVVHVSLHYAASGRVVISIANDGRGKAGNLDLAALAAAGHFGLLGIHERVELLNGRVEVQNVPGGGFLLRVEVPAPQIDGLPSGG